MEAGGIDIDEVKLAATAPVEFATVDAAEAARVEMVELVRSKRKDARSSAPLAAAVVLPEVDAPEGGVVYSRGRKYGIQLASLVVALTVA